jgi:prepilin-type N-terminal cleavage/methylation domain-containing protein
MSRYKLRSTGPAFSLTELMVVMAILAILMMLLMPWAASTTCGNWEPV